MGVVPEVPTLEKIVRGTDVTVNVLTTVAGLAGIARLGYQVAAGQATRIIRQPLRVRPPMAGPRRQLTEGEVQGIAGGIVAAPPFDAFSTALTAAGDRSKAGAALGVVSGALSITSGAALATSGAVYAPALLVGGGAYSLTRAVDNLTGDRISGGAASIAWSLSQQSGSAVARRARHQLELRRIDLAIKAEAEARKQEVFGHLHERARAAAVAGPASTPVGPAPRTTRPPRAVRPPRPTPKPFDWSSDRIPPPALQHQYRPDRPGQVGWGTVVRRSAPYWEMDAAQRERVLNAPDHTTAMLGTWERTLRQREAADAWVRGTHMQHIRTAFRHDPFRQAAETLSALPQPYSPATFSTSSVLDRYASQLESNRRLQSFLDQPFRSAPLLGFR